MRRHFLALALAVALLSTSGCATLVGTATGAFTGLIDAPAQIYRNNRGEFDRQPMYWPYNALVGGPVGAGVGPLVGFAKGMALDIEWILDQVQYSRVFGTYQEESIWRPWTFRW